MINKVLLTGRLTKAVEIRKTNNDKSVANFSLAVERKRKSADGEKITDFHDCTIWGVQAENLAKYTDKGSLIGVTGRLETRQYENGEGQKNKKTEIIVEELDFLESKRHLTESQNQTDTDSGEQTSFFKGQSTQFAE